MEIARPDVYSIGVNTVEEARSFFYTNCVPVGEEGKVASEDGALAYDLGDYGRLVYREGDGRDEMASVEVRLAGVDDVSRISFIPMSQWPNNADSKFSVGDIVRDKSDVYWICVRACRGGLPGILMTFGSGFRSTSRIDHYKGYEKVTGCASMDAWNGLAQFYDTNPDTFNATYMALGKLGVSSNLLGSALRDLYNNNKSRTHQVGDTWDNNYFWWGRFRSVWEASTDYVEVSPNSIEIKDNMPVFKSGNYYFKRNWSVSMPECRDSHSVTFTCKDGSIDKYTKKYPNN